MAKRRPNLDKASHKLRAIQQAGREVIGPEYMRKFGTMLAKMIRLRTRLGDGVSEAGGTREKLKPLSADYIRKREEMNDLAESDILTQRFLEKGNKARTTVSGADRAKAGGLHPHTTPGKSNLTRTGQLLDSVQIRDVSQGRVSVGPKGARDDGKTNEKVGQYVTDQGRAFNNPSKVELKRLGDAIKKDLRASIRRHLTKTK